MKSLFAVVVALGVAGCGVQSEVIENDPLAVGQDAEDLSATSQLLGSYKATDGTLLGLVLAREGTKKTFVAEQQVWCFAAPCYPVHMNGTWTVRLGKLYLTEGGNKHVYKYALANGVLTLTDPASGKVVGHLNRQDTWCGRTSDCDLQQWMHPMCMGAAVCTAAQTCGWYCGGLPYPGGYGDACGPSCSAGLACQKNGMCYPASSL